MADAQRKSKFAALENVLLCSFEGLGSVGSYSLMRTDPVLWPWREQAWKIYREHFSSVAFFHEHVLCTVIP